MKYNAYLTEDLAMPLKNETHMGSANNYRDICKVINNYLNEHNFYQEPYWRFLMDPNATLIDFGCWSKFVAIVPPVSNKEMMREN